MFLDLRLFTFLLHVEIWFFIFDWKIYNIFLENFLNSNSYNYYYNYSTHYKIVVQKIDITISWNSHTMKHFLSNVKLLSLYNFYSIISFLNVTKMFYFFKIPTGIPFHSYPSHNRRRILLKRFVFSGVLKMGLGRSK